MADTATLETPGLLESALAFIKGETVPKSSLLTAQARVTELTATLAERDAKITMLEATKADDKSSALVTELTTKLSVAESRIEALQSSAMTGARQAASILAKVGITAVPSGGATARDAVGEKTFGELVAEQVASGKKQGEAIKLVMVSHPAAYQTYLKTGGKL